MHRVKRAIIVAAGLGDRMHPVTLTVPKPLVPVRGQRMIDSISHALHQNGIREIYVVVGYLGEQFAALEREYPGLRLIENPDYRTANNISSLYYAREHLGDCVILDGDQIIRDPAILSPEFQQSCYCCQWVERPTREWLLRTEEGVVTACSRTGGDRGWELHSVSLWTREDGEKLRRHLEYEYEKKQNRTIYWDDVALFCHPEDYRLGIRPMFPDALVEIDSFEELCRIDPSYEIAKEA